MMISPGGGRAAESRPVKVEETEAECPDPRIGHSGNGVVDRGAAPVEQEASLL